MKRKSLSLMLSVMIGVNMTATVKATEEVNVNTNEGVIITENNNEVEQVEENINVDIDEKEELEVNTNADTNIDEDSIDNESDEDITENVVEDAVIDNTYDSMEKVTKYVMTVDESKMKNIDIISSTRISVDDAKSWARSKGATQTFINLADLFWKYAKERGGVNPAVAYAQSAKETGYGKFGGVIDETYYNTCGLKTSAGGDDSDPNAHHRFNSWDEGVQAHLDHLALYAGANGYPRQDTFDPRHFPFIAGKAKTVYELGGAWAPSPDYGKAIAVLYAEMLENVALKESKMWIEAPVENESYKGTLDVYGWALNDSGVSEINAYIDGQFVGYLNHGESRPDVDNVYPGYTDGANSGFSGAIDISGYSNGSYILRVDVVGHNGEITSQYRRFTNGIKESKMWIDEPAEGGLYENQLNITGWALNDSGINSVKSYIDGQFVGDLIKEELRPDVDAVYPGYSNGVNSGFSGSINLDGYSSGTHTLRVDVIGNNGEMTSQYKNFSNSAKESMMWIESPGENTTCGTSLNISGWGLDSSGIKEVNAYIDGKFISTLNSGLSRPDVDSAYPGYVNGANSGFSGDIDTSKYKTGTYILRVDIVGNSGEITSQYRRINISKKEPMMWLEYPSNNEVFENEVTVGGWALNDSGVKAVELYVDGNFVKNLKYGLERYDVNNAYPGYKNGVYSGFEGKIDLNNLYGGALNLRVDVVGNDNSRTSSYVNIVNNRIYIVDLNFEFDFGIEGPKPNIPQKLILHHAAGNTTVQNVHNYHKYTNGWAGIGYHFYIHKDGTIYKGRNEEWRGAHAAEVGNDDGDDSNDTNATSLGISVQGDYTSGYMPKAQEDAIVELGRYLVNKYGMSEIFRHGDPGIGHTNCPGNKYPFERIKSRILSDVVYGVYSE